MKKIHRDFPDAKIRPLGKGGRGIVFELDRPDSEDLVAKVPKREGMEAASEEYRRQIDLKDRLPEQYFLLPTAVDTKEGPPVLFLPLVRHGTLQDQMGMMGSKLSGKEMIDLFQKVTAPLHVLHEEGLAHNDFKPANLYPSFKEGKVVGMRLGDLDTVTLPGGTVNDGVFTVEFTRLQNWSTEEWVRFARRSSYTRDLDALQRTFQWLALAQRSDTDLPTAIQLEFGTYTPFPEGVRALDPKLERIPSVISSLPFKKTGDVIGLLASAKKAYQDSNPWNSFLPSLSQFLNEKLDSVEAAKAIQSDADLLKSYKAGELKLKPALRSLLLISPVHNR